MSEKIKNAHYYVYFSTNGYIYKVGLLTVKNKSEIKTDYFKGLRYYSTKERAQKIARLASEFHYKLSDIDNNGLIKDHYAKDAVESLRKMVRTCERFVANTVELEKYTNKSNV